MEDRHIICCPLSEAGQSTHLLGEHFRTPAGYQNGSAAAHALFLAY